MKPPLALAEGLATHELKPKVVGPATERRLVCAVRRCGEPIVGAVLGLLGSWIGGVHESDFVEGRFVEMAWPLPTTRAATDPGASDPAGRSIAAPAAGPTPGFPIHGPRGAGHRQTARAVST